MERRGFLSAMFAAAAGPAFVRAGSIMRVNPAIIAAPMVIAPQGQILTMRQIAREALRITHEKGALINAFDLQWSDDWHGGMVAICKPKVVRLM